MKLNSFKIKSYLHPAIDGLVGVVWLSTFFFTLWQNPQVSLTRLLFEHGLFVFGYSQVILFAYLRFSTKVTALTEVKFRICLWQLHWLKISITILFSILVLFFTAQQGTENSTDYKLLQLFAPISVILLGGAGWWYIGQTGKRLPDNGEQQ